MFVNCAQIEVTGAGGGKHPECALSLRIYSLILHDLSRYARSYVQTSIFSRRSWYGCFRRHVYAKESGSDL